MYGGSDDDDASGPVVHVRAPYHGFKVVGDNIDKTIRPSFERIDHHSISLHYYHSYAVLNRVDLSGLDDVQCSGVCDLPKLLKSHYSILISRYYTWYFITIITV